MRRFICGGRGFVNYTPIMLRSWWVLAFMVTANLNASTISSFAGGFSNSTPGFWGIEFLSGEAGDRVVSATFEMPGPGFFDLDGVGNYLNQTAPIFDPASSVGLTASDVAFGFSGENPTTLNMQFDSGAFAPGDRLQFAADIDGLGSKLGGALGAYGGLHLTLVLSDGRILTGNFLTETSVLSRITVEIAPNSVPEPAAIQLILCGGLALGTIGVYVARRKHVGKAPPYE